MSKKKLFSFAIALCMILSLLLTACAGPAGPAGPQGDPGPAGPAGPAGEDGKDAVAGQNGDEYVMSPDIVETLFVGNGTNGNFQYKGQFYADYSTLAEAQAAGHAFGVLVAAEGDVLLKNDNNALPLGENETKVTLFGIRNARMVRSGFGSGSGGGSAISNLLSEAFEAAGYSVNPKTIELYEQEINLMNEDNVLELDISKYGPSIVSTYASYNDAAVVVIGRTGSEGKDLAMHTVPGHSDPTEHYLQLDDNERALIKHVKQHFDKVVVIINSSNIMQIPELDEAKTADNLGVDAILWVGSVGQDGATAIPHILNGDVNPSGHTVDLWEKDFTKSPTYTNFGLNTHNIDENGQRMDTFFYDEDGNVTNFATVEYREGIYSGYKFYETKYADAEGEAAKAEAYSNVLYPFGYGLSYTNFEWKLDNVKANATIDSADQSITIRVWVKNTGNVAGKDVVQVYVNPPYTKGGIEKSAANLIGFGKTKLLQPGESDIVTITFYAQEFASFDWNDANGNGFKGYELEAGDYIISINRSSHEIVDSVVRTVNDGILCKTDLVTGEEIVPVYTGDYASVNDSLLKGMISRATGLVQPKPASVADRTIDDATLADYESQYDYFSYRDKETDPWYVEKLPSTWTQAVDGSAALTITLADMAGVPYVEPYINENNELVISDDENSKKWDAFMNQFTWAELTTLPSAANNTINRLGPISMSNGRASYSYGDPDGPINAGGIQFPSNPILAATFNQEMAYESGRIAGNLLLLNGSRGWRGAGANIHRSPFSGRNFEYYSEDGMMSGLIGAQVAAGATSKGIITHFKHFYANDAETYRGDYGGIFTWATEQVLRETSAKGFEYIIKYGGSIGMMNSFNRIGKWSQSTNYASHELLLNKEWGFQGSVEGDMWAKQFVPLNLGVRGGDEELLTSDSSFPDGALERGWWDAEANCVRVAANAEEYQGYNAGVGTLLSPTHYFAVRKCAQRILQAYANSSVNNNGFSLVGEGEIINYTLIKGYYNRIVLEIPGKTGDVQFTFAADTVWPAGMTYNATTGILSGTPTGETAADVSGTFSCDSWLKNMKATIKFNVESDLTANGTPITDTTVYTMKAGDSLEIEARTLSYGSQILAESANVWTGAISLTTQRIMNAYISKVDGVLYHRDEDKSCESFITLGDFSNADLENSKIYGYSVENLPEGFVAEYVNTSVPGYAAGRGSYDVNTILNIKNVNAAPGQYTITIILNVPYVAKGNDPWMRVAGSSEMQYMQTITIVVE